MFSFAIIMRDERIDEEGQQYTIQSREWFLQKSYVKAEKLQGQSDAFYFLELEDRHYRLQHDKEDIWDISNA